MSIISASTLTNTALQYTADTTGTLVFKTGATPTTALTIDSTQGLTYTGTLTGGTGVVNLGSGQFYKDASGNVGIGTTTTTSGKLNVKASTGGTALYATDSVNADFFIDFPSSQISRITSQYGTGGVLAFAIGSSKIEAMRIDSSGNLLVNNTTNTLGAKVAFAATWPQTVQAVYCTASGGHTAIAFANGGAQVGRIDTTSTATSYVTSSDYRLKENIAPMTGALDVVSKLKPVTYTWKSNGSSGQGFIAHELQAVIPDCVTGEKDAVDEEGKPKYQGIDTSFLVATLVAAIQELKAEFDEYKATHP